MLQIISVLDPGSVRREEPLDRMGVTSLDDPEAEASLAVAELVVVDLRSVYGRMWRLERPSKRKLLVHADKMDVISDWDIVADELEVVVVGWLWV